MPIIRKIDINTDMEELKVIYERAFERSEGVLNRFYHGFSKYIDFCARQGYAYLAVLDDCKCGYILAYRKPYMMYGEELYIELLAVLPEYQKRGVGTRLLDKIREQAQEEGIEELALRTCCYMDAYEIYKRYGFKDSRDDQRFMIMNIAPKHA